MSSYSFVSTVFLFYYNRVIEVTGDSENHSLQLVAKANIIITTPEKWDSLTRSWRRHLFLFGHIDLILLDEVHFLGNYLYPILTRSSLDTVCLF